MARSQKSKQLEFRLKTFDSLARKAATIRKDPSIPMVDAVGSLNDSVRYTVETVEADFVVASQHAIEVVVAVRCLLTVDRAGHCVTKQEDTQLCLLMVR